MAGRSLAAFLGAAICLSLAGPASAQFWPWSSKSSSAPSSTDAARPAQNPPVSQPAPPQRAAPKPVAQVTAPATPIPLPRPAPRAKTPVRTAQADPAAAPQSTASIRTAQAAPQAAAAPALPPDLDSKPPVTAAAPPAAAPAARTGATTALDANQRELVNRVSLYLSSIQTLTGDFVQVGPDGSKSQGQFFIQKPGRVRFEYNPPSPLDIVADGRLVAVRNRTLDTQDLFPLSQTPLRFLLDEHIDLLRETNVVGVYSDDVFATVVIEERQPLTGTSRLMMMFDAKNLQLKQWTVTDAQGYDTTVAVSNLDFTSKPDPAIFTINTARQN